ncbi:hypothetical protein BZA77DRAFT_314485 [Pyronema omphalodes]|nr:hypothetical protein BZA77DRAFT_314485 [Pyronema omphalodes]
MVCLSNCLLFLIPSLALASPIALETPNAKWNGPMQLFMCRDSDYQSCTVTPALKHGECYTRIFDNWSKVISSYQVRNACCSFYAESDCQNYLFTAEARGDARLQGSHDDAIVSMRCRKDGCNGT